jgi:hypothetical protein
MRRSAHSGKLLSDLDPLILLPWPPSASCPGLINQCKSFQPRMASSRSIERLAYRVDSIRLGQHQDL